jgi:pyruvate/2-oxoglutarate/acetoin dehydrogenase E1 component
MIASIRDPDPVIYLDYEVKGGEQLEVPDEA